MTSQFYAETSLDDGGHSLAAEMAGKETQGLKIAHKSVSDKENKCSEDDRNENAVIESLAAKHQRIAEMFLARPAALDIKIAVETSLDDDRHSLAADMACKVPHGLKIVHKPVSDNQNKYSDDSNENAVIESLKAKHQRIAEMFLARPAVQDVNMTKEKKRKKKKNKDKKVIKVEQSRNTANTKEERGQDDIITEIEAADDINKTWKILGCFDFIRSWYSKKKQQIQQKNEQNKIKRQEKRKSKRRKGLPYVVAVEIHEPPSTCENDENEGDLDACDVGDVDIHLF